MGGGLEVGNSAIRRLKNRERKILAFKVPPFKTSTDFDFEPSEILSVAYRNWKGLNFCGWMETEASKNQGWGSGIRRVQMGQEGEGKSSWVRR